MSSDLLPIHSVLAGMLQLSLIIIVIIIIVIIILLIIIIVF